MATKKDIKELLSKMNFTENDMDNYWNDLIEINSTVRALNKSGKTWRDLNTVVISNLPTQKQRDIESAELKAREEAEKAKAELAEKQEEEYYYNHFDEIMLNKIDSKEKLTEREISNLVDYEVEREEGDDRRWSRSITSYIKLKDRYFCIEWECGLTEMQENEFYNQPYEVTKNTYEKIIPEQKVMITEWLKK